MLASALNQQQWRWVRRHVEAGKERDLPAIIQAEDGVLLAAVKKCREDIKAGRPERVHHDANIVVSRPDKSAVDPFAELDEPEEVKELPVVASEAAVEFDDEDDIQ